MNTMIRAVLTAVFLLSVLTNYAQQKLYKQALDSLTHYLNYQSEYSKLCCFTYYTSYSKPEKTDEYQSPGMYTAMTNNYKSKIIITVDNVIYMLNLKQMDTNFVGLGRKGIYVKDLNSSRCIYHSAYSRIESGKFGGVPIDAIEIPAIAYINKHAITREQQYVYTTKVLGYLKQAILYSQKVKTKKSEIWEEE